MLRIEFESFPWAAKDEDGDIAIYENRPKLSLVTSEWLKQDGGAMLVQYLSITDDWHDSLYHYENSRWTKACQFEHDEVIEVRNNPKTPWEREHFKSVGFGDRYICYADGRSSLTIRDKNEICSWIYARKLKTENEG
jgi:hypothetical protein